MKRVMIDQGSGTEIMYPNLYKGLRLKPKDLSKYDTPLVGFDEKVVMPKGQIKLSIVTKGKEVKVNFIVVNAFSPYTVIFTIRCLLNCTRRSNSLEDGVAVV